MNKSTKRSQTSTKACIVYIICFYLKQNGSIISKWEIQIFDIFWYPGGDSDHSQNLMGSKLDQHPSFNFFPEDLTNSICIILLTNKQMDKQANPKA